MASVTSKSDTLSQTYLRKEVVILSSLERWSAGVRSCVCLVCVCVCVCVFSHCLHARLCVWCVCVCVSVWPGMRLLRIGLPGGWTVLSTIGRFASQVTNKAQMWRRAKSPHPGSAWCCAVWYMQKVVSLSWWPACASLFAPGTIESVRRHHLFRSASMLLLCLTCNRQFKSVPGFRRHMCDRGHRATKSDRASIVSAVLAAAVSSVDRVT